MIFTNINLLITLTIEFDFLKSSILSSQSGDCSDLVSVVTLFFSIM